MKKSYTIAVIATLEIIAVSFLYHNEWLVFFTTLSLAIWLLSVLKFSRFYIKSFVLFGVLGAMAELFPVYVGAWSYDTISLLGIPAYLPILWGSASVVIIHTANKISSHD